MSRRLVPIVLLVAVLASACWMEDGSSSTRTGWNPNDTTLTPQNLVGLIESTSPLSGSNISVPYVDSSRVYLHYLNAPDFSDVAHSSDVVKAFDRQTLQLLWTSAPLQGSFNSTLTIADGRLLVPTDQDGKGDALVYDLDAATGALVSVTNVGNAPSAILGSIAYDGTTAAVAVRPGVGSAGTDPAHVWFGRANGTDFPFTNAAVIPEHTATAPAISGTTILVAGPTHAYGVDDTPAASPGTTCATFNPCGPVWTSPALAVQPNEQSFPVVLNPHRLLVNQGEFGGKFEILDTSNGQPIWFGDTGLNDFSPVPAATDTQIFTVDKTGRVRVMSSSDCTAAGTLPTCHPTKVFIPTAPLTQGQIHSVQPEIAGRLLVTMTPEAVNLYDIGCTGSGSDSVSHLPMCGPVATIPVVASRVVVSDGSIYITTPTEIERWALPPSPAS